jgi:ligand-binding sensor domain-containing protein
MRTRPLVIVLAAAAVAVIGAAGLLATHGRARHLALPVVTDPSLPPPPGQTLAEGPPCEPAEIARVGARVTALLEAGSGELWIGTHDAGLVLRAPSGEETAPALSGRERFVNALAEHDGLVWAATQGGLLAFDGERRVATLLAREGVTALVRAGRALYAGTARGLHRIQVDGAVPVEANGPSGEPLRVTALAAAGARLWIGTASGAYALPLAAVEAPLLQRTARWHPLVFGEPPAETNVVTALAALGDVVVAGTDDGGVVRLPEDGVAACARFADARANEVNPGAAAAVEGAVLIGTQGGGVLLARARPGGLEISRPRDLARGEISAVAPGTAGALVGTAAGVVLRLACPGVGVTPSA